jgi:hypothetical protein
VVKNAGVGNLKEEFMIGDAKEHICSGCYEVIATHDPEAYQQGTFYYHSKAHEEMHMSRNWNAFPRSDTRRAAKVLQELAVRP